MDRQRWVEFADVLGRFYVVIYFGFGASGKVMTIFRTIANWPENTDPHRHLLLMSQVASLVLVLAMVGLTIFRFKPVRTAESFETRLTALGGTFLLLILLFIPDTAELPEALQITGLIMSIVGFAASIWVIRWLGRSFSIMAEARSLVTGGPYSYVRHPLYFTEEIAIIGLTMLHFSPSALVLLVVHWLLQLRRMHNEERVLATAFPEYAAYAATTPRVIPRLSKTVPA